MFRLTCPRYPGWPTSTLPSYDTREYDCRTTVVNLFEPKMFDLSLSFNKRLYFDRFSFERHKTIWLKNDSCELVRAQNVWSLTFLQQKTIFWSLFFRTTNDNLIVERQLWTLSSPRCLIALFRTTKDYILIAFLRTTQGSVIVERQLWTLSSSICLIALFRTTKDYILIAFLRTTQGSVIEERQLWTCIEPIDVWSLTFLQQKTIFWSIFFRTTQDNLIVERQLWTRSSPRFLISHFPSTKDYILIAFLSHDTRLFEPKMCDLSLSFNKRLYFDRFSFERRTTIWL